MPIALRSTTPALALTSGGRQKLGARSFIRTIGKRNSLILPVLSLTVRLASGNCDYAEVMEVIARGRGYRFRRRGADPVTDDGSSTAACGRCRTWFRGLDQSPL